MKTDEATTDPYASVHTFWKIIKDVNLESLKSSLGVIFVAVGDAQTASRGGGEGGGA